MKITSLKYFYIFYREYDNYWSTFCIIVFPRSILQPQNPKHNFDAGNKHHLAHAKTFLIYTSCSIDIQHKIIKRKKSLNLILYKMQHITIFKVASNVKVC
ncbi:hypothetical protein BpHYR1_051416 [Brachionus plicatilis]|uniref:Uncharacterized protein n=1 Tax=Brachionus plicatilis TaxID=10195 RepID=A0A3M7S229_BRAPC|nr:hypothetical protein BpHYR1_051416 [Brachionus plicatilis]